MEGRKPFAQVAPRIYVNCLIDQQNIALFLPNVQLNYLKAPTNSSAQLNPKGQADLNTQHTAIAYRFIGHTKTPFPDFGMHVDASQQAHRCA
jgi:hypothetical protein